MGYKGVVSAETPAPFTSEPIFVPSMDLPALLSQVIATLFFRTRKFMSHFDDY